MVFLAIFAIFPILLCQVIAGVSLGCVEYVKNGENMIFELNCNANTKKCPESHSNFSQAMIHANPSKKIKHTFKFSGCNINTTINGALGVKSIYFSNQFTLDFSNNHIDFSNNVEATYNKSGNLGCEIDRGKPSAFDKLKGKPFSLDLGVIDLSGNLLGKLNSLDFEHFPNIEEIYLANTSLSVSKNFDPFCGNWRLSHLDFSNNNLETLNFTIINETLRKLAYFNVSQCRIKDASEFTNYMSNIGTLDLSNNLLEEVRAKTV